MVLEERMNSRKKGPRQTKRERALNDFRNPKKKIRSYPGKTFLREGRMREDARRTAS